MTQLREAVFELHPYVLEAVGLESAVTTVAERRPAPGDFSCDSKHATSVGALMSGSCFQQRASY